jgi:hypothetical protein
MCTSAPHTIKKQKMTATTAAALIHVALTNRNATSIPSPVMSSIAPITTKSIAVHTTSFVNLIAMNGMSSNTGTASNMQMSLLF